MKLRRVFGAAALAAGVTACTVGDVPVGEKTARSGGLPAFPGAEGFGAYASGGRGGEVYYVTTLSSGVVQTGTRQGSLQWVLNQPGAKYVLFKVGGVIDGGIQLNGDNVTIAGQTAPGGITIKGFSTTEEPYNDPPIVSDNVDNLIMRHVRSRPEGVNVFEDGFRLRMVQNAILDHVSAEGSDDENFQISYANDITIQYSVIAEGRPGGNHGGSPQQRYTGMLINYSDPGSGHELDRLSIHHNAWVRQDGRIPEVSRESPGVGGSFMDIELSNNLFWDTNYPSELKSTTGDVGDPEIYYRLNYRGNYTKVRDAYLYGTINMYDPESGTDTRTYFADNLINKYPSLTNYQLEYCCNDFASSGGAPSTRPYQVGSAHAFPAITMHAASALRAHLGPRAGAFPRDPMDTRLMSYVQSDTIDPHTRWENWAGDAYSTIASPPPAPPDGDADGMPDRWEVVNGLVATNATGANGANGQTVSLARTGAEGWTNLEYYLNDLSDRLVAGAAASCGDGFCQQGETSCNVDCGGGAPGPYCGDGACNNGENCSTCAADCTTGCGPTCGDGTCNGTETCSTCPADCTTGCGGGGYTCDNGLCEDGEPVTCGGDCWCADDVCSPGEDGMNCGADCGCTESNMCDGGQGADGSCWCDEACGAYDDCCANACAMCGHGC